MIALIKGTIISKTPTDTIIDCNGVGYQLFISVNTSNKLPNVGAIASLHTLLIHKEDTMQLFGFYDIVEREMFQLLITISGIGPKSAITILSSISVADLRYAIIKENALLLQKMPGIGRKTAERIIIELKDKINKIVINDKDINAEVSSIVDDAISALIALGYNRAIAEKSIKKATDSKKEMSLEELIRAALTIALA